MRVLVTGGAGFVGSHTAKALAKSGHDPIVYDNLRTGHRWAVKWGRYYHGDLHDLNRLIDVMRNEVIDAVMHFAAVAYVGESVAHPDLYYHTNVTGTLSLLTAMRHAGVSKIVFSSSCATYGVARELPIIETTPQRPINPYGRSKRIVEEILHDYANAFGIGVSVLRYFNAAGADAAGELGEEHEPETHLLPLVLKAASGLLPFVPVLGDDWDTFDGTCVRDYVHVSDLAEAHSRALEAIKAGSVRTWNLGTGRGISVREMIAAAEYITQRPVPFQVLPRRPGDPPVLFASAERAATELNWVPRESELPHMIETAWAWMIEHRSRVGLSSVLARTRDGGMVR